MRYALAALAAALALVLAGVAAADDFTMPTLQATNPSPGVVDLTWQHLYGSYVILWQNGYDTLRPNTGATEVTASPGWHRYQVCVPAQPQDVCTNTVSIDVQ